jgi:hypothetical protein
VEQKQNLEAHWELNSPCFQKSTSIMQEVKVKKAELLEILAKNRSDHRGLFLEAQASYHKKVIEVLESLLSTAREGKSFDLDQLMSLRKPQDYTAHYDRALKMLKMSVEDTVKITRAEFQCFVEDSWDWSRQWALSNGPYVSQNSRFYNKLSSMTAADD